MHEWYNMSSSLGKMLVITADEPREQPWNGWVSKELTYHRA